MGEPAPVSKYTTEELETHTAIVDHKESTEDFREVLAALDAKLGTKHPAAQKMRTIFETMTSFTSQEILDIDKALEEYEEEEDQKQQGESKRNQEEKEKSSL